MRVPLPLAVQWFYRVLIKEPRDLASTIALETGYAVADVNAAIAETRDTFNLTPVQEAALRRELAARTTRVRLARARAHRRAHRLSLASGAHHVR